MSQATHRALPKPLVRGRLGSAPWARSSFTIWTQTGWSAGQHPPGPSLHWKWPGASPLPCQVPCGPQLGLLEATPGVSVCCWLRGDGGRAHGGSSGRAGPVPCLVWPRSTAEPAHGWPLTPGTSLSLPWATCVSVTPWPDTEQPHVPCPPLRPQLRDQAALEAQSKSSSSARLSRKPCSERSPWAAASCDPPPPHGPPARAGACTAH